MLFGNNSNKKVCLTERLAKSKISHYLSTNYDSENSKQLDLESSCKMRSWSKNRGRVTNRSTGNMVKQITPFNENDN